MAVACALNFGYLSTEPEHARHQSPVESDYFTYNSSKEVWVVDPPGSNRTQTYTYDALSRVKTMTDGRGIVTTYKYDALDHVISQAFAGSSTQTVTWTYDEAGNMTTLTDTSPTTFQYDELNRTARESQTSPAGYKIYRYDPADNVTEVAVSDEQEATKYTYDKVNLVTSVDDQRTGINKVTVDYDRHDKRTKSTFPVPGTSHARVGRGSSESISLKPVEEVVDKTAPNLESVPAGLHSTIAAVEVVVAGEVTRQLLT